MQIYAGEQLKYFPATTRRPRNSINLQKVTEIKRLRRSTRAQHDPLINTKEGSITRDLSLNW